MPDCLSNSATRLLAALRDASAYAPAAAVPDRVLAERASIHPRTVIDAAAELLGAGYLIVATCGRHPGRWLWDARCSAALDLAAARRYRDSLTDRCRAIFARRRLVKACLDQAVLAAGTGQGRLFR